MRTKTFRNECGLRAPRGGQARCGPETGSVPPAEVWFLKCRAAKAKGQNNQCRALKARSRAATGADPKSGETQVSTIKAELTNMRPLPRPCRGDGNGRGTEHRLRTRQQPQLARQRSHHSDLLSDAHAPLHVCDQGSFFVGGRSDEGLGYDSSDIMQMILNWSTAHIAKMRTAIACKRDSRDNDHHCHWRFRHWCH